MVTVPSLPQFSLTTTRTGSHAVVAVSGELDIATADQFAAGVREQLAAGAVLLDLHELSFMDSSGVKALDRLTREAAQEGWSLKIRAELHENVNKLLEITGMLGQLPFQDGQSTRQRQ